MLDTDWKSSSLASSTMLLHGLPLLLGASVPASLHAGYLSVAHYLVLNKLGSTAAKRAALESGFCPEDLQGACKAQQLAVQSQADMLLAACC